MGFRFVHTADWQIGKAFGRLPPEAAAELRAQRIRTVARIAELARDQAVDAVLVAGDAFDSNEVSDRTILRTLDAIAAFAGPWIFLPGNHDAALAHSVWTRLRDLGLPANVTIADTPTAIELRGGAAAVLPAPLRRRREPLDQTEWFATAPTSEGAIRVGLAHGSIAGRLPDVAAAANEIPSHRAESSGLGYLALGDWHGALRIAPRTWYAGTPETDRHRDNLSGQVHLVELDSHRAPERVETLAVGHYVWTRLEVELLDGTCTAALRALGELTCDLRRCVVHLELSGTIGLSERRRLERELGIWSARVHHLEVDDTRLHDEPTADDLDSIDHSGFVRLAIERLRAIAAAGADPQAADARVALRMIYLDHVDKAA